MDERVLFVDLSVRFGGAGVRAITLAERLGPEKAGLACLARGETVREALRRGLKVHALDSGKFDPYQVARLVRVIREGGYRIMDTQGPFSKLWATFAAMICKCALVSTLNSWYTQEHGQCFRGRVYQGFERLSALRTDAFICVAQEIFDKLSQWDYPDKRCFLVPNGLPEKLPAEPMDKEHCRRLFGLPVEATCLVAVGRLVYAKGYTFLLDALSQMQHKDSYLIIVGGGSLECELKEFARQNRIDDRVIFTGPPVSGAQPCSHERCRWLCHVIS